MPPEKSSPSPAATNVNWQEKFLNVLESGIRDLGKRLDALAQRVSFLEGRAAAMGALAGIVGGGIVSLVVALLLR